MSTNHTTIPGMASKGARRERYWAHLEPIFARRLEVLMLAWLVTVPIAGVVGASFRGAVRLANEIYAATPWLIAALPVAGWIIVALYRWCRVGQRGEIGLLLGAMKTSGLPSEKRTDVPWGMVPVVYVSSFLTHLCGGSAGCEGAAVTLGGGVGAQVAKLARLRDADFALMVLCGMAGAFAPLLGTPVAAAFFVLERCSNAKLSFFVPCLISSFFAFWMALACGVEPLRFTLEVLPAWSLPFAGRLALFILGCSLVCRLFRWTFDTVAQWAARLFPNRFRGITVGAAILVLISIWCPVPGCNGLGLATLAQAVNGGEIASSTFFWKILLSALTLGFGFKGGQIVPAFFVGAAFGAVLGPALGLEAGFSAALGMVAVFAGALRYPVTAGLLAFEIFHSAAPGTFLLAAWGTYLLAQISPISLKFRNS